METLAFEIKQLRLEMEQLKKINADLSGKLYLTNEYLSTLNRD